MFEPKLFPRIWGGHRLSGEFGRSLPDEPIGESWEVHGDLQLAGSLVTLNQMIASSGPDFLGTNVDSSAGFPLLVKWLDCSSWLSVQVHPDDALAKKFTGDPLALGKTEAWYVYRTYGQSKLIMGLNDGVDLNLLEDFSGLELVERLNTRFSSQGELFMIPAGMVHALGPGNLIYEVQQSSDLTYRFFDWGRPRELHPKEALECVALSQPVSHHSDQGKVTCPYFSLEAKPGDQEFTVSSESFQIFTATQSETVLHWNGHRLSLAAGESVLLPAGLGAVRVDAHTEAVGLRVEVPPL